MIKTSANIGCTRPASSLISPFKAITITPNKGSPTPVTIKPNNAIHTSVPAPCPNAGGKIILPAPKNSANNIKLIANISENFKDDFISTNLLK